MIENLVTRFCSPTLAGLKTGSLFTVRGRKKEELTDDLRKLNRVLTRKGLRALLFTAKCGNNLVYIYRPKLLKRDLSCSEAESILKDKGYSALNSTERCIVQLAKHISNDTDFPHEIRLF
jgi:predicted Zn-ribbon and HTH transcriptional regulator